MDAKITPPEGYHTITPRMVVADLTEAASFLRKVFDARGEVDPGRPAELRIGDSMVMVSAADERDVFPAFLYVYVDDADLRTSARWPPAQQRSNHQPTPRTETAGRWCVTRPAMSSRSPIGGRSTSTRSSHGGDDDVLDVSHVLPGDG
jgi:hypothetical protein